MTENTRTCMICAQNVAKEITEDLEVKTPDGIVVIKDNRSWRCQGNIGCDDFYDGFQSEELDEKVAIGRAVLRSAHHGE